MKKFIKNSKKPILFPYFKLCKKYYDNPNMLWNYIADIFERGSIDAKRIYNRETGYNKDYTRIVSYGWKVKEIKQRFHLK